MKPYRLTLSFVVALVLLFTTMVGSATDRVSEAGEPLYLRSAVEKTTDGAKAMWLSGDALRAKRLYEKAIEADSAYAPARYSLATLMMNSDAKLAADHALKAYQSDTTNRWYLTTYAQSLVSMGRMDEAIVCYEKLVKLNSRDINAYRILAILYSRSERMVDAIAILDTAELRVGQNDYLTQLKRQLLITTNQVERAIQEGQEMVAQMPYSAENRVAMAELYAAINSDSLAMAEFGVAMRIDSTRIETQLSYCDYLRKTGRNSEYLDVLRLILGGDDIGIDDKVALVSELTSDVALYNREFAKVGALISTLLTLSPNNGKIIDMQVRHLISLDEPERASEFVKGYIQSGEAEKDQYKLAIAIEQHLNRADSVEHYLQLASERFPDDSKFRYERAYLLTSQSRYDEAIECYKSEMRVAADSLKSSIVGTIGDIYQQISTEARAKGDVKAEKKNLKLSYKKYEAALKLDPDNALVLNNYAYFISERGGDLQKALKMTKRSNELESSNPTFLDTYAWVLYRMGQFAEAKVIMRQAISFDRTENGEIAMHYGEILSVLGEDTMANFYWDKALSWGMPAEEVQRSRERAGETLNQINNSDRAK